MTVNVDQVVKMLDSQIGIPSSNIPASFIFGYKDGEGYSAFLPKLDSELKKILVENYFDCLNGTFDGKIADKLSVANQRPFDIEGNRVEDQSEYADLKYFEVGKQTLKELFKNADSDLTEMSEIKEFRHVKFYAVQFIIDTHLIVFITAFTSGMYLSGDNQVRISGDTLRVSEPENNISLKPFFDLMVFDDVILILNRGTLAKIFNMDKVIKDLADRAMESIKALDIIDNYDDFLTSKGRSNRVFAKRIGNLLSKTVIVDGNKVPKLDAISEMQKSKAQEFKENFLKLQTDTQIQVKLSDTGKLIFPGDKFLAEFIDVLADSYFKTYLLGLTESDQG